MNKIIFSVVVLVMIPFSGHSHHGTNGQFDASKIIQVTGVISDIAFVNPHAYVYIDVTNDDGETETWNCELRAASVMKRSGWRKEMFANGIRVDIVGVAARRDPLGCYVETISFNGGEPIERYAQIKENQITPDSTRPAVTKWGAPNFAGDWAATQRLVGPISGPNAMAPIGRRSGGRIELTDSGIAALARLTASEGDNVTGRLDCTPRDFFADWIFDQHPNSVVQEEDKIVLNYGFMDTIRTIHIDLQEHPSDIEPSFGGHSIGKWDGDVLVVETIGFTEGASRRNVHSSSYRTVEKFSLQSENGKPVLMRSYQAYDPEYWTDGSILTGEQILYIADYPYEPYACDDRSVE